VDSALSLKLTRALWEIQEFEQAKARHILELRKMSAQKSHRYSDIHLTSFPSWQLAFFLACRKPVMTATQVWYQHTAHTPQGGLDIFLLALEPLNHRNFLNSFQKEIAKNLSPLVSDIFTVYLVVNLNMT